MAVAPAHPLGATDEQLKLVGEIIGIQGTIELDMVIAISWLLGMETFDLAQKILGRSSLVNKAEIWLAIIEAKSPDEKLKQIARDAVGEAKRLSSGRNDFVHAAYLLIGVDGGVPKFGAMKNSSGKIRPLEDLQAVRDQVAAASHGFYAVLQALPGPIK